MRWPTMEAGQRRGGDVKTKAATQRHTAHSTDQTEEEDIEHETQHETDAARALAKTPSPEQSALNAAAHPSPPPAASPRSPLLPRHLRIRSLMNALGAHSSSHVCASRHRHPDASAGSGLAVSAGRQGHLRAPWTPFVQHAVGVTSIVICVTRGHLARHSSLSATRPLGAHSSSLERSTL